MKQNNRLKKVMVIGSGMMGGGIAELCAISGYQVILVSHRRSSLRCAKTRIRKDLVCFVEEGFLSHDKMQKALSLIKHTMHIEDGADADYVIESITENMAAKQKLFQELQNVCKKTAILGSDTSTLSITEIASVTNCPGRIVGMHFFSSVPKNRLLEVVPGKKTSKHTMAKVKEFAIQTEKQAVIAKDSAGFIINRLQCRTWNEAVSLVEDGMEPQKVDMALLKTVRPNWGMLSLIDYCSLPLMNTISEILYEQLGTARYRPSALLKEMIERGECGEKSGRGFFDYR